MGVLERESWKSGRRGDDDEGGGKSFCGGGVVVTRSSRHWRDRTFGERGRGPVGVVMGWGWDGAMDWKAWIGRASKNSWANMNGVLDGSERWL